MQTNKIKFYNRRFKLLKYTLPFICCFIITATYSQQVLSLKSINVSTNQNIGLEVQLQNTDSITAVQFDLTFNANGLKLPTVSDSAFLSYRSNGHTVSLSQIATNSIRVIIFSLTNSFLKDIEGTIVTINAITGSVPGVYSATFSNVTIANANGSVACSLQTGAVTIQSPKISIYNNPINLGRLPLFKTYNGYLYTQNTGNQGLIIKSISNRSGEIVISNSYPVLPYTVSSNNGTSFNYSITPEAKGAKTDTLIIHSNDPTADSAINIIFNYTAYPVNGISLNASYTGIYNTNLHIPVSINNYDTLSGLQLSITLPDGVSYVNNSVALNTQRKADHVISANQTGNILTIVSYSPSNSAYKNNSGEMLAFDVLLNKQGGTYSAAMSNCVLSDLKGNNVISDSSNTQIIIKSSQISLTTSLIDFGRITTKQSASYNLNVTNNGTDTLVISQITIPSTAVKTSISFPFTILPQTSSSILFNFSSPQSLTIDSFIIIKSSDPLGDKKLNIKGSSYSKNEINGSITAGFSNSIMRTPLMLTNYDTLQGLQFDVQIGDRNSVRFIDSSFRIAEKYKFLDYSAQLLDSSNLRLIFYSIAGKKILPDSNWLGEIRLQSKKGEVAGNFGNINFLNGVISNNANQNVSSGFTGINMSIHSITIPILSATHAANICDSAVTISPLTGSLYAWYKNDTLQPLPINNIVNVSSTWSAIVNQFGYYYISNSIQTNKLIIPPAPIISVKGDTSVCQGHSVILNSSAISGNQWYKDGLAINGAIDTVYAALLSGSYCLKYNNGGCNSLSSANKIITIFTVPSPAVTNITYSQNSTAAPLTATALTGDTLRWYGTNADGGIGNSTAPIPLTTVIGSTNYYVSQFTPQGCESSRSKLTVTVSESVPAIIAASPSTAIAGSTVTIIGANFTGTTAVSFGGVAASSFIVVSSTTITAIVGTGSTGSISITTPLGTASFAGFSFVPKPTITAGGSTTFITGGSVVLTATPGTGYIYQWIKDGVNITGATNATYTATQSGSYSVNISLNTISQLSTSILITAVFSLPSNNFTITNTSASCKGSANGSINIKAAQHLNYTATVTNNSLNKSYPFTDSLSITTLTAGSYTVCITVSGQSTYQQCFTTIVTEPKDISLYMEVKPGNQVVISLSGATTYSVNLNGNIYTTTESQITLPLANGNNSIVITSDKACQGAIERTITVSENIIAYPNPVDNILNLSLGKDDIKTALISIISANGELIYSAKYANPPGLIKLDLSRLIHGLYMLKVSTDYLDKVIKIMKK